MPLSLSTRGQKTGPDTKKKLAKMKENFRRKKSSLTRIRFRFNLQTIPYIMGDNAENKE